MNLLTHSTIEQISAAITGAASLVIDILTAAGWRDDDILAYVVADQPDGDHQYEQDQINECGDVRIAGAEMRAEIRRLLTATTLACGMIAKRKGEVG